MLGVYNDGRTGGGFWSGTGRRYALKAAVRNLIGFGRVGSRAERCGRRGGECIWASNHGRDGDNIDEEPLELR